MLEEKVAWPTREEINIRSMRGYAVHLLGKTLSGTSEKTDIRPLESPYGTPGGLVVKRVSTFQRTSSSSRQGHTLHIDSSH